MDLQYVYNEDTCMLHIKGFCYNSSRITHCKEFSSEQEVREYASRPFRHCRICEKKKEKLLTEAMK